MYDTCNYMDYPVGGEVTSIRNFLRYIREEMPQRVKNVLLVGVSCKEEEIGNIRSVLVDGTEFKFLAVTLAATDLSQVKKSLRLEYVKGIWKYKKLIGIHKNDCQYIHTPEAFGVVKFLCPKAACYVFSHGTYFDMWKRVRFFKKQPLIRKMFQSYLLFVIRKCRGIFVLERETYEDYAVYNKNVVHVGNSIVCHPYKERKLHEEKPLFFYAGRLSHVKNIGPMIEAVIQYEKDCSLLIAGDGEERLALEKLTGDSKRIHFAGAVTPDKVQEFMAETDILIMNSVFEGIPMTILEAISNGMPVITTNVGGIKEVLRYGEDSIVTDGSVASIHVAMDGIIEDYEKYSKEAYETSLSFDYRKVNKKVFDVLNVTLQW